MRLAVILPGVSTHHLGNGSIADSPFAESYTQKLWMRVKRKAAYLPG